MWQRSDGAILWLRSKIIVRLELPAAHEYEAKLKAEKDEKANQFRISDAKYREIIADNLSKAGWSWGWVSAVSSAGRTIWAVDAHRGDGKRFVVRAESQADCVCGIEIGDSGTPAFSA